MTRTLAGTWAEHLLGEFCAGRLTLADLTAAVDEAAAMYAEGRRIVEEYHRGNPA